VPSYGVEYYVSDSGKCPVAEFLNDLAKQNKKASAKCVSYIDLLRDKGLRLTAQYVEKVEDDIWALRPEWGNVEYRLFFTYVKADQTYVLVEGIVKGSQKFKARDLNRVRARVKEVLDG
jgi:phage-related protein